jgi:hypothetical protein
MADKQINLTKVFNFLSFIALCFIGLALALARFISSISAPLMALAYVLMLVIVIFYSGAYVFRGGRRGWIVRNWVEFAIWIIASTLVVVFQILNLL